MQNLVLCQQIIGWCGSKIIECENATLYGHQNTEERQENITYRPVSLAGPIFAKARSTSSLTCLNWTLQKINKFPKIYRKHSQIHTEPAIQHPEFFKDGNKNRKGTNYLTTRRRIGSNDEQSLCKLSTFRASTITLQENSKTFWDKFQQGFQVSTS